MKKPLFRDENGQPLNLAVNYFSNKEKAIFALRGILTGILADNELSDLEIPFLKAWLEKAEALANHGDRVDLLHIVNVAIKRGSFTEQELFEMREAIREVIEYGQQSAPEPEKKINELLGNIEGLIADAQISDTELEYLETWLKASGPLLKQWPGNLILNQIREIKADGKITSEERSALLETLKQISGQRFADTGIADSLAVEFLSPEIKEFDHNGKKICFTGKFITGSRVKVEALAREQGAVIADRVTTDLDALIIGSLASKDWRFTSYGRKIQSALDYNQSKSHISILSERQWLSWL